MIGRADKNGPQGDGVNEELSFTLNTVDKHAVVYAIDRESFNCGQNYARNLGITEDGINSTLKAQGPSAVATPIYSSSKASFFTDAKEELANTLVATDYKDPPLINDNDGIDYTVRRLTPTECARLQGFPDWWCSDLGIELSLIHISSVKRMVGLTGTPSSNGLMDLWAEFRILDLGQRLGRYISHYRNTYFKPDKRNAQIVFSYKPLQGAEEEIYQQLSDITISMKSTDYLKMPEYVSNEVFVTLSDKAVSYTHLLSDG